MNLINQSGPLFETGKAFFVPVKMGISIQDNGIPGEIGARLLYLIQMATSVIALPIISFVGFCQAVYLAITCQRTQALSTLQDTLSLLTAHFIMLIPTAAIGIVATKKFTEDVGRSLLALTIQIANCWSCSSGAAEMSRKESPRVSPPGGANIH